MKPSVDRIREEARMSWEPRDGVGSSLHLMRNDVKLLKIDILQDEERVQREHHRICVVQVGFIL